MMPDLIQNILDLGYEVGVSQSGDGFYILYVSGFGLGSYVRSDDRDALKAIVEYHDERVLQQGESPFDTALRWHGDPDNDLHLESEVVAGLKRLT
jgi:hypothetical protein